MIGINGKDGTKMQSCQTALGIGLLLLLIAGCSEEQSGLELGQTSNAALQTAETSKAMRQEFDPCALIALTKVEEIVGKKITAPVASIDRLGGVTYLNCSSSDIHITIEAWGDPPQAAASFDFGAEFPAIGGLGERAKNTQPTGEVDVLSGSYVVSVDLFMGLDRAAELEAAQEIARIVLENIPK
ncbi:MAG: hypothetical protein AB2598_01405 [Candidatus Thiodiazotropha sp.]